MNPETTQTIGRLFDRLVELPPAERRTALEGLRAKDPALHQEVSRLLLLDREVPSAFLTPTEEAPGFATPSIVGAYRVVAEISRGLWASVYRAEPLEGYRRVVAIKVLAAGADAEHRRRFEVERQILASLEHPNIARLYDGGTTPDGRPYLVMEYLEGLPLTTYCDRQGLGLQARLRLFLPILEAVGKAHRWLIVHRDLKPANILVTGEGIPKLLDFGIAKLHGGQAEFGAQASTHQQARPMTPAYASPEQVRGDFIQVASDVYSLGVLLYEVVTGLPPYVLPDGRFEALCRAILEDVPVPMSASAEAHVGVGGGERLVAAATSCRPYDPARVARGDLDAIVAKALRKEPEARYGSARALAEDLRRFLECRPVRARRGHVLYRAQRFFRRHRLALMASVIVLLSVVTFGVSRWQHHALVNRERAKAERGLQFLVEMFEITGSEGRVAADRRALDLLDAGAARALRDLAEEPEVRAAMLHTIGGIYYHLGHREAARRWVERALADRRRWLGEDHRDVALSLYQLGRIDSSAGATDEAVAAFRRAAEIQLRGGPSESSALAATLLAEGQLRQRSYDYESADALYRRAHALVAADPDHDALRVRAESLEKIGFLAQERGRREEASALYQEALELRGEVHGWGHPNLAIPMALLARLRHIEGEFRAASKLYEELLIMELEHFGFWHPRTSGTLNDLAQTLIPQQQSLDAVVLFQASLAIRQELGTADQPDYADVLGNLAIPLRDLGRFAEALEAVEASQELRLRTFGPHHPKVALCHHLRGTIELRRGRLAAAETAIEQAARIIDRSLPEGHRAQAYPRTALGEVRLRQGRPAAAVELLEGSLQVLRASHAPGHWRILQAEGLLAAAELARGEAPVDAMQRLVKAFESLHDLLSPRSEEVRRLAAEIRRYSPDESAALTTFEELNPLPLSDFAAALWDRSRIPPGSSRSLP